MVHTFVFSVQKFKKIMSLRTCYSFVKIFNSNARCMSFKSGCSIDKIYPNSNEIKHLEPPVSEDGKFNGYIPVKELVISYTKAGAPGGQNVHKNETKVDLRFNVASATWIRESTKQKLLSKYGTRINKDGFFIIRSEKTRHRDLNLADALTYLREILFKLEDPEPTPSPESLEKIRKNKEKANRIRLMEKRYHSLKKQSKGSIDLSDI